MNEFEKRVNTQVGQLLDNFVRGRLLSDEFLDFMQENTKPLDTMMAYYRCAIMEVETKFKVLNEQFSLEYDRNPIESIKTRVKSMESIVKKVRRKNIALTLDAIEENIQDIAGVRVVCSFPEDIYLLADCLLQQDDIRLIERKDYIEHPKESGYRSLHLIVAVPIFLQNEKREMKVEVQLRTIAMDFWASLEHKVRYKKNIPEDEAERLATELTECAHMSAELDQRMQDIRNRLAAAENKDEKKDAQQMLGTLRELANF
jgi:putative GTP pyrophosphokinase